MKYNIFTIFFIFSIYILSTCSSKPIVVPIVVDSNKLDVELRNVSDYLNNRLAKGSNLAIVNVQSDYPLFSEYIIDMITENILNDNIFTVVGRNNLNLIQEEIEYHLSGNISDETTVSIGKRIGAEIIVSGIITQLNNVYNLRIRAISVETAVILGQFSVNIPYTEIVAILTNSDYNYDINSLTNGTLIIRSEAPGIILINGEITEYQIRENGVVVLENYTSGNVTIAIKYLSGLLTEDVTIIVQGGKSVTAFIRKINDDFIFDGNTLKEYNGNDANVRIPRGVTQIGAWAFGTFDNNIGKYGNRDIITVYIPDTVTEIGYSSFYGCINLISVNIPESVEIIGSFAFYGCSSLQSIHISKNVRFIQHFAFSECDSLNIISVDRENEYYSNLYYYYGGDSNILMAENFIVRYPPALSFYSEFTIPNNVTTIFDSSFEGCRYLRHIIIPEGITEIENNAFLNCINLETITLPQSIRSIGNAAFYNCPNLEPRVREEIIRRFTNDPFNEPK